MLEGKKDNLSLFIDSTPLVGDVAVCICIKTKLNSCCLNKLLGSCGCNCFPAGSEEACLCYSIYLHVRNVLCGNPLAASKSKVADVQCGVNNGSFFLCWKVKGNGSVVRKSLGIALKALDPAKMYSGYSFCVKEAGGSADREAFNHVADEMIKSINSHVHCGVVGNIKLEKTDPNTKKKVPAIDIHAMLEVLQKKINVSKVDGKKSKPSDHKPCDHSECVELKSNGINAFIIKDFISAKIRGLNPVICDQYVLLNIIPSKWNTAANKIKAQVKDYAQQKYSKLGDNLSGVLGYLMLASASVSCQDVQHMLKSGIKGSDVEKALNNVL